MKKLIFINAWALLVGAPAWAQPGEARSSTTAAAVSATATAAVSSVAPETVTPEAGVPTAAEATPPASAAEPTQKPAKKPEEVSGLTGFAGASDTRPYYVSGLFQFRARAVSQDVDAHRYMAGLYRLELGYKPAPGFTLFGKVGATQNFVSWLDHPPFLIQDVALGGAYTTDISLAGLGYQDKSIALRARALVYLPTSLISQRQDLKVAPELGLTLRFEPSKTWMILLDVYGQYRAMGFADRASGRAMNVQAAIAAYLWVNWTFLELSNDTSFSLGATISGNAITRYADRYGNRSRASELGWSLSLSWAPLPSAWVSLGLEQNGPVMRDGIVNVFFTKLEETEVVLSAGARY